MSETLDQSAFADELRPAVERLYDRHLEVARPWSAYDVIDWSQAEGFGDKPWSPSDYPLNEAARSSVVVNLLTEDNAPYYTHLIKSVTPKDHPLQTWNNQWTMEEGQHSYAIRTWAHLSRAVDPDELEAGRRTQMAGGVVPQPETLADMLAYVPFQEKATQIAHSNTGSHLPREDKTGRKVLALVAGDETKHYNFYRDVAGSAIEVDPSAMVIAISSQVRGFAMPGTGIPGFKEHADKIAKAGIYNLSHFKEKVVEPTLEAWDIKNVEGLNDEAEVARDKLFAFVEKVGRVATRLGHTS
ncbi:MAG TPA: acyl-ACP desaturase [Candidatus Saccharimonadales bacterium]|nr:acyl-ACP desaturase [Candidatus Saccharimonadales bacterium]